MIANLKAGTRPLGLELRDGLLLVKQARPPGEEGLDDAAQAPAPAPAHDPGVGRVARVLVDQAQARRPLVVGLTGAVASGKSTFAGQLQAALVEAGLETEIVCTDGFLMPNARLTELGILDQKGFPPSYDTPALHAALAAIRTGPASFPAYSHVLYDIDPSLARTVAPPDVLIVDGLNLHHRAAGGPDPLDLLIYLDADEALLEAWFLARFMGLYEAAEHDPASFYARFRPLGREGTEGVARQVWQAINLKNLREHIVTARARADLVVRKGEGHAILAVEARES
jgi:type I pantothenate kinase